ncbi:MAG: 30S ribosomal protein S16, partial [Actinomycetia bacterium]|nr:30S ribosomal protein S16 [Actinomycetes bacterium]
ANTRRGDRMAVKIRLTRLGKKKQPTYRVVVMDSRKQRDGKYIEQLGIYDPKQEPSLVKIDNERALYWLNTGAQPTERAQKLLEISGAWTQFRVARGDIHTVGGDAPEADTKILKEEPKAEAETVAATVTDEVPDATSSDAAVEADGDENPVVETADSSDES